MIYPVNVVSILRLLRLLKVVQTTYDYVDQTAASRLPLSKQSDLFILLAI